MGTWWKKPVWRIVSVAIGLVLAGLFAAALGKGTGAFYRALGAGSFGGGGRLIATLAKVAPLLLAGLAVAVPLRAGLFNIGAEGQMYAGAVASVTVSILLEPLPAAALVPLALLAGIAAGAAWGALAGALKSRFGVHEVISTIMLNFAALHAVAWLVHSGPLADPRGVGRTPEIAESARLPILFSRGAYELSAALVVALLAAAGAWWLVGRTVTGYRMRAAGANPLAAGRKGINVPRMTLAAMAFGGAFAGLGGALEVCGVQYAVSAAFSPGYGFDGIAVALVAGAHALAVPAAAFLFAAIRAAGTALQLDAGLSKESIYIIEAVIVIAAAVPALPKGLARLLGNLRAVPPVLPAAEGAGTAGSSGTADEGEGPS